MPKKKVAGVKASSSKPKNSSPQISSTRRPQRSSKNSKSTSSIELGKKSILLIYKNWKTFGLILFAYLIFNRLFVRGFSSSADITALKNSLHLGTNSTSGSSIASALLGTSTASANNGALQPVILIFFSVILIWSIRETINKHFITARDAFYKSLYPLLSFGLVAILLVVESIPLIIATYLFSVVFVNNIANNFLEKSIFVIISVGLFYVSLYLILSTILALYIVTLPDIRPMQAIRSSWKLVKHQRVNVFWKILFICFALVVLNALITLPFIFIATSIAGWVFFIMSIISILIFHTFMYHFYRDML